MTWWGRSLSALTVSNRRGGIILPLYALIEIKIDVRILKIISRQSGIYFLFGFENMGKSFSDF